MPPPQPHNDEQTEVLNKIIKHTLKAKLEDIKGCWPEELPNVFWSYNPTMRFTIGEIPFILTYGCEVIIPVEIGAGSFRREYFDPQVNEVNHLYYLDMIEETRANSEPMLASYQQRMARHYNVKVRTRPLKVRDIVLRRVMPNTNVQDHGVFGANWEGPSKIKALIWADT